MGVPMSAFARVRRFLGVALVAGLLVSVFVACGGGSEVAPANPVVVGVGTGSIRVDGQDLGGTQLVRAIVSASGTIEVAVTETVTFSSDTVQLAHRVLTGDPVSIVAVTGGETYEEGDHFSVVRASGTLTRVPAPDPAGAPSPLTPIPLGEAMSVSYRYLAPLLTVQADIVLSTGAEGSVTLFNVPPPDGAGLVINESAGIAPADGSLAFNATLDTDLLESVGKHTYVLVETCELPADPTDCPVQNELVIDSYDVSNELDPCISGRLVATMRDTLNPTLANRAVIEMTFDDPECP